MTDPQAKKTAIAIVAATALLVAALCIWRTVQGARQHVDIDTARYPVRGIDLSRHNGEVDFRAVAADGIHFAYLKASEGINFRDSLFRHHTLAAAEQGIAVGAYHFFRFDCDGTLQALNLIHATDSLPLSLPPAIDVEEWGNPANVSTDLASARIVEMVETLRAHGIRPVIYTNKNGYRRFFRRGKAAHGCGDIWICSFSNPPLARNDWRFWQHSHIGTVSGVNGPVDLNTFNGSLEDFRSWCSREL